MSDMKCPVCKTGNVEQGKHDKEYFCDNEFCPSYDETDSSTYNILIRTRKALDLAIDTINKASDALIGCQEADNKYISDITAEDALELLSEALGKIRFLQKDVK